jgi:hypothetical protein
MHRLQIAPTIRTAGVDFDPESGFLSVQGNSIPENADGFFQPLHDWIEEFSNAHPEKVKLRVFMTYFNTATIRHIISMMKRLVFHYGDKLTIEWAYERGDEEIRERGQDLSEVVKFTFVFEEVR